MFQIRMDMNGTVSAAPRHLKIIGASIRPKPCISTYRTVTTAVLFFDIKLKSTRTSSVSGAGVNVDSIEVNKMKKQYRN